MSRIKMRSQFEYKEEGTPKVPASKRGNSKNIESDEKQPDLNQKQKKVLNNAILKAILANKQNKRNPKKKEKEKEKEKDVKSRQ